MSIVSMCMLAYFMRVPDMGVAIVVTCILLGTFALGCYPLALELVVEATYPVDQVRHDQCFPHIYPVLLSPTLFLPKLYLLFPKLSFTLPKL